MAREGELNSPVRARYGATDNMHGLLKWDGEPLSPPPELLGLTDKPPGSYAPGERWWPSVGCGPVRNWWALWWTEPDREASRGGMVRSEVALWSLDEVGAIGDLRSVMETLGGRPVALAPADLTAVVAEALLDPGAARIAVADLDAWPGLIAALWARIWPLARRAFSARVAVSPPQGGDSVAPPTMFGIPLERAPQWSGHRVVESPRAAPRIGRAAQWLVHGSDAAMGEVLSDRSFLTEDIRSLRKVARAADRLDRLRAERSSGGAVELLRTLVALAPAADAALALKLEALNALSGELEAAPAELIASLGNLVGRSLPPDAAPRRAVEAWVARNGPALSAEHARPLFEMLAPERAEDWWREAVGAGMAKGLADLDQRWAKAGLRWLGSPAAIVAMRNLLLSTPNVESRLLDAAPDEQLPHSALVHVRLRAEERGWSRLHAWTLMHTLAPREAIRAQMSFPGDPRGGLALLIETLPGADVVAEAIASGTPQLVELAAVRTVREPALLVSLDASEPAWRALWAAHVVAGGAHWPPGVDRAALSRVLLDAALQGAAPDVLVVRLASDLASLALEHPARATLWKGLRVEGRNALLAEVSAAAIAWCERGREFSSPEPELLNALLAKSRATPPSPRVLALLVESDARLDEHEVVRWLQVSHRSDWTSVAGALGRAIEARRWGRAAQEMYDLSRSATSLLPAVLACQSLLSGWQRFFLSLSAQSESTECSGDIVTRRVAEVGASLAHDRLDDLWDRAGGERKRLPGSGSPDVRWREAATLAQRGGLRGGVSALLRELMIDFPYNSDLKELDAIFNRSH